ncbi:MAG TPA: hypothetical protein VF420_13725 [Casimicrobiaceae bacterium]
MKKRSSSVVVHSFIDVKSWAEREPSVDVARPACCPRCGGAARAAGEPLGLVGHGLRDRQVRGVIEPGGKAAVHVVRARRYRCCRCSATVTVVPRGCVPARHYGAGAIALACVLHGMQGHSLRITRARVSPWHSTATGWPAMGRWLVAIGRGAIFARVRAWPSDWVSRRAAERVAQGVLAVAPIAHTLEQRVFAGAERLACG